MPDETPEVVVDFSGRALKLNQSEDSAPIVEALQETPHVTCLNLSGNTLGIEAAEPIGKALERNAKLEKCLWSDLFTGRLKSEIAPALMSLSSGIMTSGARLVELDLSDNAFGPNGVVGVVELIASPACSTLKILRMNNQGLGHDGCRHLAQALQKGRAASGKRGLLLKIFSGGRNRLENFGAKLLSEVFSDMGSLEELSLYQNGIGIHGIEGVLSLVKIIKSNKDLRVLNLSDNSLTPQGGKALAKALRFSENLEELHLSDCILRSAGASALARVLDDPDCLPNLRVLNLTGNEINRNTGISLVLSLGQKSKLELLDLNTNEFGQSGVQAIIRTLDSVGLLHTLSVRSTDSDSEAVGDTLFTSAFDDDQGSASEGEEDVSEGEEGDQQARDESNHEEDTGDGYEEYEEEEEEDKEASFNTVEERPISQPTAPFSFRALAASMGDGCSPASQTETTPVVKPQPSNGGLFAALTSTSVDSTDAASMRSKLWPMNTPGAAPSLFSPISGVTFGKGHLFSPPILSLPSASVTNGVPENGMKESDLKKLETQLRHCLQHRTQSSSVDALIDTVKTFGEASNTQFLDTIQSCALSVEPEDVVRLSLQLCRYNNRLNQVNLSVVPRFAVDLLASILISNKSLPVNDPDTRDALSTRAANCLLVHLGAIKAEKHSEDYEEVAPVVDAVEWERRRVAYLSALRQLIQRYGTRLTTGPACNCIKFLLAQQSAKTRQAFSPEKSAESDRLQDDLVSMLEAQMSRVQIA